MNIKNTCYTLVSVAYFLLPASTQAIPLYQAPGPNLTYGDVTHSQRVAISNNNPASPAATQSRGDDFAETGAMIAIGAGLEYGNIDNIFDLIDRTSESIEPSDGVTGGSGKGQVDKPGGGVNIDEILNQIISNNPQIEEALKKIEKKAILLGGALALIATDGYGKAFITADAPVTLKTKIYDGTLSFNLNSSAVSKVAALADSIDFNPEQMRAGLQAAAQLANNAGATDFQLGGDLTLTVDPSQDKVRLKFQNDSLLVTKAAKVQEFSVGYSHPISSFESGQLFLGVKPKFLRVGLARVGVRFGDLSDSEELFDDIRNAEFLYDEELSLDIGAMWVSDHYQLGGALTNINQPTFAFPTIDTSKLVNQEFIDRANKGRVYEMERQLKLEGGIHSIDRKWVVNAALDTNAAADPMGDDYQWASVSAGYATKSWWVPGARVGVHSNLAGTELTYLSAGVTLFKYVDLDISSALDTVDIDGQTLPRGLNISLGVAASF